MIDEKEIRRRFAEQREADLEHAPTFAQTLSGELEPRGPIAAATRMWGIRRPTLRVRPLVIGAAAVVLIAAALFARGQFGSSSAATLSITTWTAPTDVFLWTPGGELLAGMPALGASILDSMIPKPSNRGT